MSPIGKKGGGGSVGGGDGGGGEGGGGEGGGGEGKGEDGLGGGGEGGSGLQGPQMSGYLAATKALAAAIGPAVRGYQLVSPTVGDSFGVAFASTNPALACPARPPGSPCTIARGKLGGIASTTCVRTQVTMHTVCSSLQT